MGKYLACQFTKENRLMVYQHQRDAQIINPGRNKIKDCRTELDEGLNAK